MGCARGHEAAGLLACCVLAVLLGAGCASAPPTGEAPAPPARVISDFRTVETREAVVVLLKSDQPLAYTATPQESPRGLFLQFPDTGLDGMDSIYYPPPNPVLRAIRAAETGDGREARILLELAHDAPYEVLPDPEGLKIALRKPVAGEPAAAMPPISGTEPTPGKRAEEAPPAGGATKGPPAPAPGSVSLLREVATEVQADKVLIRLTIAGTPPEPRVFTLEQPPRIVFDFMGLRSAFAGEQRTAVRSAWVRQVRHLGYPEKVRLVADTEGRNPDYALQLTADGWLITFGGRKP